MLARLKKQRRKAHEAMEKLFPRTEARVVCRGRGEDRQVMKAELRRMAIEERASAMAMSTE